jgi:hypothetical protein
MRASFDLSNQKKSARQHNARQTNLIDPGRKPQAASTVASRTTVFIACSSPFGSVNLREMPPCGRPGLCNAFEFRRRGSLPDLSKRVGAIFLDLS